MLGKYSENMVYKYINQTNMMFLGFERVRLTVFFTLCVAIYITYCVTLIMLYASFKGIADVLNMFIGLLIT